MGNYSFDVLVRKWSLGELTVEQAIGQIIQILMKLAKRIEELEGKKCR